MSESDDRRARPRSESKHDPAHDTTARVEPAIAPHSVWQALLTQDVDTIVDELCNGRPRDLISESRAHVENAAYFVEEGRLAARAIATVASLASNGCRDLLSIVDTLIEECTAEILDEGPVVDDPCLLVEDPDDDDPPLAVKLSQRLGVSIQAALDLIPWLNRLPFDERHIAHRCLLGGISVSDYAATYRESRREVAQVLDRVQSRVLKGG